MNRRSFLSRLLLGTSALFQAPAALPAIAPARRILLQQSPLAGFQYHDGEALWSELRVGAPLQLAREPDNRHDPRAVAIRYAGRRIGYLPRVENTAVSQLLDRGETLSACITKLEHSTNPWERVGVAVEWVA